MYYLLNIIHRGIIAGGTPLIFVDENNNVVRRNLINYRRHPDNNDIAIGLLDNDVPNNIKYAKILPSNWLTYLPGLSIIRKVPIFWFNQNENIGIYELTQLGEAFTSYASQKYTNFFLPIIRFDSGSPFFMLINNEPVLLGVLTGGGTGTFTSACINEINSVMSSLGGSYSLTPINLSSFNTY